MSVKLNIGCFTTMFRGWRNSDIITHVELLADGKPQVMPLGDWARSQGCQFSNWSIEGPIPYDDGVVDLIFAMHVLEHVPYDAGARFLKECHRAMKPGGVLRILVPDARALCAAYLDGTIGKFDEFLAPDKRTAPAPAKLWEPLCAGHAAIYDAETLGTALRAAGFENTARPAFGKSCSPVMQAETRDLYPGLSLIIEAVR